ncbi:MAG: DEAD/DEAH box helicase [Planctomycetota bacterium]
MPLSSFQPIVRAWFHTRFGAPTPPQARGWPAIRRGEHTLIAAPTGAGKTLAAFLVEIDRLLAAGVELADATQVLYVSPLKALASDVRKNLEQPLSELRALDASLPEIRVSVRTGDTSARERARMVRTRPHILVTTPESFYILLGSQSGRAMLKTVRTVIVDEIHAVLGDKRGAHLALSLERLDALCERDVQRIGLSATQRPIDAVAQFLCGGGRSATIIDEGHVRALDLAIEVPGSPLSTVASNEQMAEIYLRVAELVAAHRTTLVFVDTRKMAERVAARLQSLVGAEDVTCHHSSLALERRLAAETRLKSGALRVLVATASLELGIDIGDIDLVVLLGAPRAIATLLQRVGRSGHALSRTPRGRLFPLTQDELVAAAALLLAVDARQLDRIPQPLAPLDILAQHLVAACAADTWQEDELFARVRRAWPYRELARADFEALIQLQLRRGRRALLHRDGVGARLRGTRAARLTATMGGGAIPDRADYQVVLEPEGTVIGAVDEDFAVESTAGDVFQLGTNSWRVLGIGGGKMRVADARGAPPSLPFWLGEAPARTPELCAAVSEVRARGGSIEWLLRIPGVPRAAAEQIVEYLEGARTALGTVPTIDAIVLERFFDESGGMQLVLHAPFGGRINRAWGLALRKRFCRHFGFELQAAASEEAIVLSLGPQHSFALGEVFDYLRAARVRDVLVQALLDTPMFKTRWRWNVCRALLVARWHGGRRVPAPLIRMRADDLLVESFPEVMACGENLPPGDLPVPFEHPIVRQTIEDCLTEALDCAGLEAVLARLERGEMLRTAVDTVQPSPLARSVLSVRPYGFLDDAPLEERRTQAVAGRRGLSIRDADQLGALDPQAVERVRAEAWPNPTDAEEVHEALSWMGFVTTSESGEWRDWLVALEDAGRVVRDGDRYYAAETLREPLALWRGRLEALGPVQSDDPLLVKLESEGFVLRVRIDGADAWCERRLLARIHRYTLDELRRGIEAVSIDAYRRFLACWQHVDGEYRLTGPGGVLEVVRQLAGFEVAAPLWERSVLPARVSDYQPEWLDQLAFTGQIAWGRLWGSGAAALKVTPIAIVPRETLPMWFELAAAAGAPAMERIAREAADVWTALERSGAQFQQELERTTALLPSQLDAGLAQLIGLGLGTNDSFAALRRLLPAAHHRRRAARWRQPIAGRWSVFRRPTLASLNLEAARESDVEPLARALLRRYGVVCQRVASSERHGVPWRRLLRALRTLELRGEVRGGRFVSGLSGEQFALPEAVPLLRAQRDRSDPLVSIAAGDPLDLASVLVPQVASVSRIEPTRAR